MGMRASKLGKFILGARGSLRRRSLRGPPLTPRGYVPICVGLDDESETKRFMVRTALFGDTHFSELLYRSAEEYGFCNEGILRIPCGAKDFEDWITKRSSKPNFFRVKPI